MWEVCRVHQGFVTFQDSIDLFLGNFALDESDGPTPLRVQKDWKFLTVSIVFTSQQQIALLNPYSYFFFVFFVCLAVAHYYAGGVFHVHRLSSYGW